MHGEFYVYISLHLFTFLLILCICSGDTKVIERISYEFVEDQARESVAYCEVRFSPHLLLPSHNPTPSGEATHLNGSVNGINGEKLHQIYFQFLLLHLREAG